MKLQLVFGVIFVATACAEEKAAPLQPILAVPDSHGHIIPSVGQNDPKGTDLQDNPEKRDQQLLGRPDGHDLWNKKALDTSDGHDIGLSGSPNRGEEPLLGKPDGHERGDPQVDLDGQEKGGERNEEDSDDEMYDEDYWGISSDEEEFFDKGALPDPDEPVIRCKRPICENHCFLGFQTDSSGCQVCDCLEDPCVSYNCSKGEVCITHPCESRYSCKGFTPECIPDPSAGHPFPCAIPMCANRCSDGYYVNEYGCMTCQCNEPPSPHVECPQFDCLTDCSNGYVKDKQGCSTCECIVHEKPIACPVPMCATSCPNGYENNEHGCMTCNCKQPVECPMFKCAVNCIVFKQDEKGCQTCECDDENRLCGDEICEFGQVCAQRVKNFKSVSVCAPQPLCHTSRSKRWGERFERRGGPFDAADCERDGTFKPMQCSLSRAECWCVDDTGREIEGTRTGVYVEEHKPNCKRNITVAVTIQMLMIVDDEHVHEAVDLDELKATLPNHLSRWMLVDTEYISVMNAQALRDDDSLSGVLVELLVRHGGDTDLPAAIDHLKRKLFIGDCAVHVGESQQIILTPEPESLVTEHKFSLTPNPQPSVNRPDTGVYSEHQGFFSYCLHRKNVMIIIGVCAGLIFITVCLSIALIIRRHRSRKYDFSHQRLESQLSSNSEKSLMNSTRDDNVVLMSTDGIVDEKAPIA